MRVLLSCLQSLKDHNIPGYKFWRNYFVNGLREAGHEVLEVPGVDWAEALIDTNETRLKNWRTRSWEKVEAFVRREVSNAPIDVFLSYLYPEQVDRSGIKALRHLGVPSVNFFCDNVRMFRKAPKEFDCFDLHWVPEYEALGMYRDAELPFINAPMPCWVPPRFRTIPEYETKESTFIGSFDVLRQRLFFEALRQGSEITVYGSGWVGSPENTTSRTVFRSLKEKMCNQARFIKKYGFKAFVYKIDQAIAARGEQVSFGGTVNGPVSDDHYVEKTRNAIVAIGVNRVPSYYAPLRDPIKYSRLRDIEAPMLGACYITEWTEGVARLYEPGKEIELYHTGEELAAKLKELRRDSLRRRKMRHAAQSRALSEHSIAATLRRIESYFK